MKLEWNREILIILAASFLFVFWGIGSISLLDPDEGMYGAIAREMAEKGDWITPHFNGIRYLEKPPLYFWFTAITIFLFGPSEWAARLWSALPTLGTAILTWSIGRALYDSRAGLLSAIILVTSVGVFRYTRVAATDSLLVLSLTLSLYGFIRAILRVDGEWQMANRAGKLGSWEAFKPTSLLASWRSGALLFWLGMALGVLSKGLVGFILPVLIVGVFLLANGKWRIANGGRGGGGLFAICYSLFANPAGLVLFLGLTVPWHLLAAWKNPGFLQFYFVDNQFLRFLSNRAFIEDDVPVSTVVFLGLILVWFFPWSLFLSRTLRHGFPSLGAFSTPGERPRLLIGLWALTVIGFFSLSSSKLEHYILPALPALSLMVGALWAEASASSAVNGQSSMVNRQVRGLKWLLVASAAGCGLAGIGLIVVADHLTSEAVFAWLAEMNVYYRILKVKGASFPFSSVAPFVPLARELGVVLVIGLPLALVFFYLSRPLASFTAMTGVAAGIAVVVFKLLFVIEPHHSAKSVALALKAQAQQGELIVHEGSLEYSGSLPFYTGRQIHVLNGQRGDLDFGSRYPEGQGVFLDDGEFGRRWQSEKRVFLVTRLQEGASVIQRLPVKGTFLLGRYGSRLLYSNHGP